MKYLCASAFIFMSFHLSAIPNVSQNNFVSLFDQYCYSFKDKPNEIRPYLEEMGHTLNPDYDAYEIFIGGIDYAITPQQKDCTTDVLLSAGTGTLFTLDQIEKALTKKFNLTLTSSRSFQDVALNNQNTKIQQRNYRDGIGHDYRLLYPSDNQDSYYMTFTIHWTET